MACGAAFRAWPPAGQCLEIKAGGKSQAALRSAEDGQRTEAPKPNSAACSSRTRFRAQSRVLFRTPRRCFSAAASAQNASAGTQSPKRRCRNAHAQTPPIRGRSGGVGFGFRSVFESKFEAPKTPPSHGFTDFAAIKAGAKKAMVSGVRAGCASRGYGWPEALLHPATGGARSGSRPPSVKKRHWPSRLTRHAPQPWSSKSSKPTASGMGSPLSS